MSGNTREWSDAFLEPYRQMGDPIADDVVRSIFEDGDVDRVNALMHQMVRDDALDAPELPDEVRAYLATTLELPPWADLERIDQAQRFFQLWGVQIAVSLFCASLPMSYAGSDGVKALYLTARLDTDTKRRVIETGQFLMDVMTPGSLVEGGDGRNTIQRVRLMHAAVRHLITERAKTVDDMWDPAWGYPINQEDLVGTHLAFSHVVIEALRRLGVDVDDDDAGAYLHCWNVISYLLGVREELLPVDLDDADRLTDAIRLRQFAPSPEGKEMTAALVDLLTDMLPLRLGTEYVIALIRHLIGDDVGDIIQLPAGDVPDGMFAELAGRLLTFVETTVARNDLLQTLAEPFGKVLLRGLFAIQRGGVRAQFAIPEELARTWDLTPDAPPA